MSTALTLKNIPDVVCERLKQSAATHRRSFNSEAIVCLETVLLPGRMPVEERLARARKLRAEPAPAKFSAGQIDSMTRSGRR